jgi:UDP-N-acetylglucosamine 4-epimerase
MYETVYHNITLGEYSFLVTGGAGFIGSNIVTYLLRHGAKKVRVLDNFSTGHRKNLQEFMDNPAFELLEGDIRNLEDCKKAVEGIDYVSHQAALGSVPRSMNDPITTNEVNISGFLNVLVATRDAKCKRFVYAASSSTYGDHKGLPKVEDVIGKPLSPYAVTKYVNELYADVFGKVYGMEVIGLRYFNVFGPKQDPEGSYAAVIPKFVAQFIAHESPLINGKGEHSRDFTYIDNVVQANVKAFFTDNEKAVGEVYNVAYGDQTSLKELADTIKDILSGFDGEIANVDVLYGPYRAGDIPHSLASIEKARTLLNYDPRYSFKHGLNEAIEWYWKANQALKNEKV